MVFIMLLLFIVAFIFAIVAIVVFEPLSKSERTDLTYKDSFKYNSVHYVLLADVLVLT